MGCGASCEAQQPDESYDQYCSRRYLTQYNSMDFYNQSCFIAHANMGVSFT